MRVAICILFLRKALASEASWVAMKIWLPIHPQNFGSYAHPSAPKGNQCDLLHFLASVGACNLILRIHVVAN